MSSLQFKPLESKDLKIPGEDFILLLKKSGKKAKPKIVISKKIARLAVDRNRVKRLFREALREIDTFEDNVTIIVKKNISDHKMRQVQKVLEKWLKK